MMVNLTLTNDVTLENSYGTQGTRVYSHRPTKFPPRTGSSKEILRLNLYVLLLFCVALSTHSILTLSDRLSLLCGDGEQHISASTSLLRGPISSVMSYRTSIVYWLRHVSHPPSYCLCRQVPLNTENNDDWEKIKSCWSKPRDLRDW